MPGLTGSTCRLYPVGVMTGSEISLLVGLSTLVLAGWLLVWRFMLETMKGL